MKTKILVSSLILALSAYSFASSTNTDQATDVSEAHMVSLVEPVLSNSIGRNQITSSHTVSNQSNTALMQPSIKNKKGRNLDLQSFALKNFMRCSLQRNLFK